MRRSLSNTEMWDRLCAEIAPAIRICLEKCIDPLNPPPFRDFIQQIAETIGPETTPLTSLLVSGVIPAAIVNPDLLPLADALRLARAASHIDAGMDYKILAHLARPSRNWPADVPPAEIMRVLTVIDEISDCERLVLPLMKFARLKQPHLRSKAVKLLARGNRNISWADVILRDPNPRVRSNLIEEIAGHIAWAAEPLLRKATEDPHYRVATTSLLALAKLGDAQSRETLGQLALNSDEMTRRAAAWALHELELTPSTASPHPIA